MGRRHLQQGLEGTLVFKKKKKKIFLKAVIVNARPFSFPGKLLTTAHVSTVGRQSWDEPGTGFIPL